MNRVDISPLVELVDNYQTPVVRTDFSDDAAWDRISAAVAELSATTASFAASSPGRA